MASATIRTNIRVQLLHEDTTDAQSILPDDFIDLMYADAQSLTNTTDSIALRYYACYLISKSWSNLDSIQSREGVSYRTPDPQKFLSEYHSRILDVGADLNDDTDFAKVAIQQNTKFNEDDELVRRK